MIYFLELLTESSQYFSGWMVKALIVWTIISLVLLTLLRFLPHLHAVTKYGLHISLLIALPLSLFCSFLFSIQASVPGGAAQAFYTQISAITVTSEGAPAQLATEWFSVSTLLGLLIISSLAGLFFLLIHFVKAFYFLKRIEQRTKPASQELHTLLQTHTDAFKIRRKIRLLRSGDVHSPITYGLFRPVIIIPESEESLPAIQASIYHELVHIHRYDILIHYCAAALTWVFFWNPVVHWLRKGLHRYRELSCDSRVLSLRDIRKQEYARLLLSFADSPVPERKMQMAMAENATSIKERISAMSQNQNNPSRYQLAARSVFATATVLLIAIGFFSACELGTEESSQPSLSEIFQEVETEPQPIGGVYGVYENLTYPQEAREAGTQGVVVITFVVDKYGEVHNPEVLRGIGDGCDEAAIEAIKQTKWEPGEQRGTPVNVQTQMPIRFELQEDNGESEE